MPVHAVGWRGTDTSRTPSKSIWGSFPFDAIRSGELDGLALHYNFADFRTSANINAAEAHWCLGLKAFGSDGAAIAALDEVRGGITLSSDGDNEGASIGQMIYPFQVSRSHYEFCFEALIKSSTITDTKHGFFLGMIDASALSATVPIAAAGTLADENFVGFHRLEGDGDAVDTVYKADGVTQVSVQTDAVTLVADTFIKLGMKFTPKGDKDGPWILSFYSNGTRLSTSKQIPAADGTDFPNDVRLGWVFAVLNATASTPGTSSIQWLRVGQMFTAE